MLGGKNETLEEDTEEEENSEKPSGGSASSEKRSWGRAVRQCKEPLLQVYFTLG